MDSFLLAGAVGLEPTIFGTRNRCLTIWPRPIVEIAANFRIQTILNTYSLPQFPLFSSSNRHLYINFQ